MALTGLWGTRRRQRRRKCRCRWWLCPAGAAICAYSGLIWKNLHAPASLQFHPIRNILSRNMELAGWALDTMTSWYLVAFWSRQVPRMQCMQIKWDAGNAQRCTSWPLVYEESGLVCVLHPGLSSLPAYRQAAQSLLFPIVDAGSLVTLHLTWTGSRSCQDLKGLLSSSGTRAHLPVDTRLGNFFLARSIS